LDPQRRGNIRGLFRDTEEMYEIYASLFDLLGRDSRIGLRLANAGLVVRFRLSDPDGMVNRNSRVRRIFIIANPQWFLL
jgi:hypothetical protein